MTTPTGSAARLSADSHKLHRGPVAGRCLGVKKVLAQNPHDRPRSTKRSPAPLCHCHCPQKKAEFKEGYRGHVTAYRAVMARLRQGVHDLVFPAAGVPPMLAERGVGSPPPITDRIADRHSAGTPHPARRAREPAK